MTIVNLQGFNGYFSLTTITKTELITFNLASQIKQDEKRSNLAGCGDKICR